MNDYRNFQRRKGKKKGTSYNKYCKGKQSLKQKNKYYLTASNKHNQIKQTKHTNCITNVTIVLASPIIMTIQVNYILPHHHCQFHALKPVQLSRELIIVILNIQNETSTANACKKTIRLNQRV